MKLLQIPLIWTNRGCGLAAPSNSSSSITGKTDIFLRFPLNLASSCEEEISYRYSLVSNYTLLTSQKWERSEFLYYLKHCSCALGGIYIYGWNSPLVGVSQNVETV